MKIKRKTSGIIIIGNEVLSGKTLDTNSNFLCKKLHEIGIECKEISVVEDIEKIIVKKVNSFRKKFDFVFTTGGIGPTHDDITSKSIAVAFKDKFVLNKLAKARLKKHYSDELLTKARLKMAYLPSRATLIDNPVSIAPGFSLDNVHVFPGVPKIFEIMLTEFIKGIGEQRKFFKKNITTEIPEGIFAEYVGKVQKKYPDVDIGSYPYFKKKSFCVSLIIKSDSEELLDKVCDIIYKYLDKKNGKPRLF